MPLSDSDSDSDFSDDSAPNDEDLKMKKLLAEWDERDAGNDVDLYVDSDDDDDDSDDDLKAKAKKQALMKHEDEDSDDGDEDEEEEEIIEEEVVESESEPEPEPEPPKKEKKKKDKKDKKKDKKDKKKDKKDKKKKEKKPVVVESSEESESEEVVVKEDSDIDDIDDIDDDESDFEEEVAKKDKKKAPIVDSDEESEEEEVVVKDDSDFDDESDFDDDDDEVVVKDSPVESDDKSGDSDDDDDDDDEAYVPEKKPKKKKEKKPLKKITDIDDDDDDEDKEMKALLADWDADMGDDDDDEDDEDESEEEESEASEREVVLEDNVIDHIVLACDDLDVGMAEVEKKTSIAPQIAGTIKGLGIKCARISFADSSFMEIIAPDPNGPGPIGELIKSKKIKELTPFHYAIRTTRAEELKDEVGKFGYTPDHITMFGAKADGTPRKWEMLYLYGHRLGGICPFFINWANSDHPCKVLPVVGKLKKITIRAPEDDPVHQLLDHVSIGNDNVNIETGKAKFSFSFASPEGTVKYSASKAVGFKFPGFEADVGEIPGDDGEQDAEVVFENPELPDLLPVSDMEYDDIPPSTF